MKALFEKIIAAAVILVIGMWAGAALHSQSQKRKINAIRAHIEQQWSAEKPNFTTAEYNEQRDIMLAALTALEMVEEGL